MLINGKTVIVITILILLLLLRTLVTIDTISGEIKKSNNTNVQTVNVTGNITTTTHNENWLSDPLKFLSHPFILVVIGSTISGGLIAFFTHIWGKRQNKNDQTREDIRKDIELKIELVNKINSSVINMIMISLYGRISDKNRDNALYELEISRAIIKSNLQAYFPDKDISSNWDNYYHLIQSFYSFTGLHEKNKPEYEQYIDQIKQYMPNSSFQDWDSLKTDTETVDYSENVTCLAEEIEKQKEVLIKKSSILI